MLRGTSERPRPCGTDGLREPDDCRGEQRRGTSERRTSLCEVVNKQTNHNNETDRETDREKDRELEREAVREHDARRGKQRRGTYDLTNKPD
jgi:hypothetical protein